MFRNADPDVITTYLKDASNLDGGYADEVVIPENEQEVISILEEASRLKIPVTISGKGTGTVGARIPFGGKILSTEKLGGLKTICLAHSENKQSYATLGPAITHKELQKAVLEKGLIYPPDPTEQNAFIGASVATNASGARSFKYGATRNWIRRLKIILATGDVLELCRGECRATYDGWLVIHGRKKNYEIRLPNYRMPQSKHSAGYYAMPGMSAIDLFIGSEGTLGVFTEIEVSLIPGPQEYLCGIVFFGNEKDAWQFAMKAKGMSLANRASQVKEQIDAYTLEYFDFRSLDLLRQVYTEVPQNACSAIFFEQGTASSGKKKIMEQWYRLCQDYHVLLKQSWFGRSVKDQRKFREFRHALPVLVNRRLRQYNQKKIGTDFSVSDEQFPGLLYRYHEDLKESGLLYCIFGHFADNHLHINVIPRNEQEARKGGELYWQLTKKVIALGGTVSAEHGIGKVKRDYLMEMYGQKGLMEMSLIKKILDPAGILGRGNIIPEELLP